MAGVIGQDLRTPALAHGAAAIVLLAASLVANAAPERWSAIKSTGGIAVGAPFHASGQWLLSVRARLSRLESKDPNAPDGGLSCVRTEAVVEGSNIFLTIISGEARGPIGAVCPAARLGELEPGTYKVFYRGPGEPAAPLKDIELKR